MSETLPNGWSIVTLGEILPLTYGKSLVEDQRDPNGKIPVYASSGLVGMHANALIDEPAIIVGRKGNVGAVYLCSGPSWIIDTAYYAGGFGILNLSFFYHLLAYLRLAQLDRSTAVPGLGRDDYNVVEIKLPPQDEQARIVAEIEKQFTRLDAAVAALKRVRANLKRYRASVLKAACEGRLVPTEAELARKEGRSYETGELLLSRILKERRAKWEADELAKMLSSGKPPKSDDWKKKYEDPRAPNTGALPKLPDGWVWSSLDQLICSGPQNGLYKPVSAYGSGMPILRIDDFQLDFCKPREELRCLHTSAAEDTLYALAPGDIVLNRVNSPSHLGKSTVVTTALCPCVFESNMMRFHASDFVNPEWVTSVLQTVDGKARLTANAKWAVNQASINQQDVKHTPVQLPPVAEQTRILDAVKKQLSINSKTDEEVHGTIRHADRLRQSILKRAFEGKLVPQDSNDEPASTLLERIRARSVDSSLARVKKNPSTKNLSKKAASAMATPK